MLMILLTISVALIAALSAIGVCEQCRMESGGVYFLLSHVMGARFGSSIGVLYCFGMVIYYIILFYFIVKLLLNLFGGNAMDYYNLRVRDSIPGDDDYTS